MNKNSKILKYLSNPMKIIIKLDDKRIIHLTDEKKIRLEYKDRLKKDLNLDNPQTFNEKLQWLKLNNRKSIYTTMVDKCEVKKYVSNIIGEKYIIPTIGVYNSFDEIDFDKLPNQFVIKCTHDSGGLVIVKDKSNFNKQEAKRIINKFLKRKYFYIHREWPYKNVKPRIIVETYMEDESKYELKDYKIFCFNGQPKLIMVDSDRFTSHKRNVYDTEWNKLDLSINFPNCDKDFDKPQKLDEMLELSKKLSKDIPFIRTDFYSINDRVYFGELTLFPGSGYQKIAPEFWQEKLGSMIDLSNFK